MFLQVSDLLENFVVHLALRMMGFQHRNVQNSSNLYQGSLYKSSKHFKCPHSASGDSIEMSHTFGHVIICNSNWVIQSPSFIGVCLQC